MADFLSPVWDPSTLQQFDYPDNIPELSGSSINEEQRELLSQKINELRKQQLDYLSSHPEIRAFLGDFLDHIWDFMPPLNLFPKFCREYFSQCKYELQSKINKRLKKIKCEDIGAESNHNISNRKCPEKDNILVQKWSWSSDSESEEEEKLCTLPTVHQFVSYVKHEKRGRSLWGKRPTHSFGTHVSPHTNPNQKPVSKKRQSQIIRESGHRFLIEPPATIPVQQTHNEIVQKAFDEFLSFDMKDKE